MWPGPAPTWPPVAVGEDDYINGHCFLAAISPDPRGALWAKWDSSVGHRPEVKHPWSRIITCSSSTLFFEKSIVWRLLGGGVSELGDLPQYTPI